MLLHLQIIICGAGNIGLHRMKTENTTGTTFDRRIGGERFTGSFLFISSHFSSILIFFIVIYNDTQRKAWGVVDNVEDYLEVPSISTKWWVSFLNSGVTGIITRRHAWNLCVFYSLLTDLSKLSWHRGSGSNTASLKEQDLVFDALGGILVEGRHIPLRRNTFVSNAHFLVSCSCLHLFLTLIANVCSFRFSV